METYSFLRELADSWVLLVMTLTFVGIVIWAFRPWARDAYADTAAIPLRHEDAPIIDDVPADNQKSEVTK